MSIAYVDSSAWAKLLVEEDESAALESWVDSELEAEATVVSAYLLMTELHRVAHRAAIPLGKVTEALSVVELVLPTMADYRAAGLLPGSMRSLDALHVAVALSAGANDFVTYDERQADAARAAGIRVISPT